MNSIFKTTTLLLAMTGIMVGCGVSQEEVLRDARSSLNQAQASSSVNKYAQTELYTAEKALKQAESAKSTEEMVDLAKIAKTKADLALEVGTRKATEAERTALGKEKTEVILAAREKEIDAKAREAEAKAKEAELSRLEAERQRKEAEMQAQAALAAKSDAEKQRLAAEQAKAEAEKLLAQNQALMQQLKELQGRQTERGLVLTLGDVLFETAKADLLPSAADNLSKIAAFLRENPKRNVLVEGHTDDRGGDSYNMQLSESRANSVRSALLMQGIDANRILARGYGESRPIESNATETGRQKNRRVEITILNEGEVLR